MTFFGKAARSPAIRAVETWNPEGESPVLLICEHASPHLPDEFGNLGLSDEALSSHIAYDPGALEVARTMSSELDAALVAGRVSRLALDCNRDIGAPDLIPERSEIYEIPGNRALPADEKARRIREIHDKFHESVETILDEPGRIGCVATIHSFTPVYFGVRRSTELGVLHDACAKFADLVIKLAPCFTPLRAGRNEPYGPADGVLYTIRRHAIERGLPNVMLEIRNDLIRSRDQQSETGKALAELLAAALERLGTAAKQELGACPQSC